VLLFKIDSIPAFLAIFILVFFFFCRVCLLLPPTRRESCLFLIYALWCLFLQGLCLFVFVVSVHVSVHGWCAVTALFFCLKFRPAALLANVSVPSGSVESSSPLLVQFWRLLFWPVCLVLPFPPICVFGSSQKTSPFGFSFLPFDLFPL